MRLALAREPVDAGALAVLGGLPLGRDELLPLEAVQRRVERAGVDLERLARMRADRLGDAVAVPRPPLQSLQNQQVECPLQQLDLVPKRVRRFMGVAILHPWVSRVEHPGMRRRPDKKDRGP